MELKNAKAIVDNLTNLGIDASLYENYSGRGMYGRTTAGVVVSSVGSVETAMKMLDIDDRCRTDSMGLDVIVY